MAIEGENIYETRTFRRHYQRCVSKVHWKIGVAAHERGNPSGESFELNSLDSPRLDQIDQLRSSRADEITSFGENRPRGYEHTVKLTEKRARIPVPAIAPIE